jgi:hypothetical protein
MKKTAIKCDDQCGVVSSLLAALVAIAGSGV